MPARTNHPSGLAPRQRTWLERRIRQIFKEEAGIAEDSGLQLKAIPSDAAPDPDDSEEKPPHSTSEKVTLPEEKPTAPPAPPAPPAVPAAAAPLEDDGLNAPETLKELTAKEVPGATAEMLRFINGSKSAARKRQMIEIAVSDAPEASKLPKIRKLANNE